MPPASRAVGLVVLSGKVRGLPKVVGPETESEHPRSLETVPKPKERALEVYENFVAHGAEAIETMRLRNPEYVRAAGAILPKQTEEIANPFDGITSDELAALANLHTIRWLLSAIERAIACMRPKKQR
jgi:hypothetical protein